MSFVSTDFIYNNIKSSDMGVVNVRIDNSGFADYPIAGEKRTFSDKVSGKDIIYHFKTDINALTFQLTLTPSNGGLWTDTLRWNLFKWLNGRQYLPFQTVDDMSKMIYAIATNTTSIFTTGINNYIIIEFTCSTPYWLSFPEVSTFDLSTITSPATITLKNLSNVPDPILLDYYYYPKLYCDLKGTSTSLTLTNNSDGQRIFQFTGLQQLESLYIDNQLKQIQSSVSNVYRLTNFNKNWLRLVFGTNQIIVNEQCILQVVCQYPIFQ